MITVESNLGELNKAVALYLQYTKLTTLQAIVKQGEKLAFSISQSLKGLIPGKWTITQERLAALRSGSSGVRVRKSIIKRVFERYGVSARIDERQKIIEGGAMTGLRFGKNLARSRLIGGKRMNLQALAVQAELRAREGGRGYASYATRMNLGYAAQSKIGRTVDAKLARKIGRYGQKLGDVGITANFEGDGLIFTWGGEEEVTIGEALNKPQLQEAVAAGISNVTADIQEYIARKQLEAVQHAFDRVRGGGAS